MNQIRLTVTNDLTSALDLLKKTKFPVLSYPEIIKTLISDAVSQINTKKHDYSMDEPTSEELMKMSAHYFGANDPEEVTYTEKDGKPFTY